MVEEIRDDNGATDHKTDIKEHSDHNNTMEINITTDSL